MSMLLKSKQSTLGSVSNSVLELRVTRTSKETLQKSIVHQDLITFALEGIKIVHFNGTKVRLNSYEGLFIPANTLFYEEAEGSDSRSLTLVLSQEILHLYKELYEPTYGFLVQPSSKHIFIDSNPYLKELILFTARISSDEAVQNYFSARFKVLEVLHFIQKSNNQPILQKQSPSRAPESDHLLNAVTKLLEENSSIENLSKSIGLSASTFKRRFRFTFDESVKQWIIKKKLEKARLLLTSTQKSVKEIAYECGFNDASYFIRLFKRSYGTTPLGLRMFD